MKQLITFILLIFSTYAYNQCSTTVDSPNGDIEIQLQITGVDVPEECENGYVFNPIIEYTVSTPVNLYTLQGTVGCSDGDSFFNLPNSGGSGQVQGVNIYTPETNCTNATAGILGCLTITLEIHGQGVPNQTIILNCENLLPIELLYFNTKDREDHVLVEWITGDETPSRFYLQRSKNGYDWKEITNIRGKGSSSNYKYRDYDFESGQNYYRLINVDTDGYADTFGIRGIFMENITSIEVVNSQINFSFENNTTVRVFDIVGREVKSFKGKVGSIHLRNGVYFVANYNTKKVNKIIIGR